MKIGLALSGGGARGFAHIGVLRVFVENDIPIDMIAGTSAGSIIAGAFASGMSVDEIDAMAAKASWSNMVRPSLGFGGMMSSAPMGRFLAKHFPVKRFEDCKIPFATPAFDLASGENITFRDDGNLITAIRASCAVPGIFAPVRDEAGRMLVDGGVISPMPVGSAKALGAEKVIAVDLLSCGNSFSGNPRTSFGIVLHSALATIRNTAIVEHRTADVVIEPQIAHLRIDQIGRREEFIALGEQAAREALPQILSAIE